MTVHTLPLIPGVRLELQGACNRCGLCCTAEHEGRRLVCEYLRAELEGGAVKPLGAPMASRCRVYEYRHPLRPLHIRLLDARGIARLEGQCHKDAWQEDAVIAERGLGQGCSLTLPVSQGQLVAFTPDRRA